MLTAPRENVHNSFLLLGVYRDSPPMKTSYTYLLLQGCVCVRALTYHSVWTGGHTDLYMPCHTQLAPEPWTASLSTTILCISFGLLLFGASAAQV